MTIRTIMVTRMDTITGTITTMGIAMTTRIRMVMNMAIRMITITAMAIRTITTTIPIRMPTIRMVRARWKRRRTEP